MHNRAEGLVTMSMILMWFDPFGGGLFIYNLGRNPWGQ